MSLLKQLIKNAVVPLNLGTKGRSRDTLRILTYHRVNRLVWDRSGVRTPDFEEQIAFLKQNCELLRLSDLFRPDLNTVSRLKVLITFDDGYRDNLLEAAPILHKYGVSAVFFVAAGFLGTTVPFPWDAKLGQRFDIMTVEDVRELVRMGHDIGSHSWTHRDFGTLTPTEMEFELAESKRSLEDWLSREITAFAYPFGRNANSPATADSLVRGHYRSSFLAVRGPNRLPLSDGHRVRRVSVLGGLRSFVAELDGKYDMIEQFR